MANLKRITAQMPKMDDCPILTRLKAFVVDQGVTATLTHVFRDRKTGNPLDLSDYLASAVSISDSASDSSSVTPPAGTVKLRVKEWLGQDISSTNNPIWEIYGEALDPATGNVEAVLEEEIVEHAGIYELNWAVLDENGRPVCVDRGILSVERSMFTIDPLVAQKNLGPPTLQELRMRMMDSSRNENLLLDDVEFQDEQILLAMWEPIRYWNETPPPLRPLYTTKTFPFRGAWVQGVMAQLHLMAAHHYRRNTFRGAAGSTSDKDKEKEYLTAGKLMWDEYKAWVANKKVEINLRLFSGFSASPYLSKGGW